MTLGLVMDILRRSIFEMVLIGGPILIVPLIVGLIISIFQATTQIQEQTLTFVPKVISIFAVLILMGPWILTRLINYINYLMSLIGNAIK